MLLQVLSFDLLGFLICLCIAISLCVYLYQKGQNEDHYFARSLLVPNSKSCRRNEIQIALPWNGNTDPRLPSTLFPSTVDCDQIEKQKSCQLHIFQNAPTSV